MIPGYLETGNHLYIKCVNQKSCSTLNQLMWDTFIFLSDSCKSLEFQVRLTVNNCDNANFYGSTYDEDMEQL